MKRTHKTIAFTGIVALALFVAGTTHLDDKELGIGLYGEQAFNSSPRLDDRELGISEFGERGHSDAPRPNEQELGIGIYGEHA